jgi:acyl-coenzyme A synthetase/AMP-(fatty) acid ligase
MTGDTACVNTSGHVILTGRIDRMMIDKNGENVYPEEIEKAICSTPGVAEAYVTQIQDETQIGQITALVRFSDGSQANEDPISRLRSGLMTQIPHQQIPSFILEVPEIPKDAGGKVSTNRAKQLILSGMKKTE